MTGALSINAFKGVMTAMMTEMKHENIVFKEELRNELCAQHSAQLQEYKEHSSQQMDKILADVSELRDKINDRDLEYQKLVQINIDLEKQLKEKTEDLQRQGNLAEDLKKLKDAYESLNKKYEVLQRKKNVTSQQHQESSSRSDGQVEKLKKDKRDLLQILTAKKKDIEELEARNKELEQLVRQLHEIKASPRKKVKYFHL